MSLAFHWGKPKLGEVRFETNRHCRNEAGGGMLIFRRWIRHRIKAMYGISFGHRRFIGIMELDGSTWEDERIK